MGRVKTEARIEAGACRTLSAAISRSTQETGAGSGSATPVPRSDTTASRALPIYAVGPGDTSGLCVFSRQAVAVPDILVPRLMHLAVSGA